MNHFRWQNVFDHSMMCIMDYNHFGVGLTLIDPLLMKVSAKNDFYNFIPSDFDL